MVKFIHTVVLGLIIGMLFVILSPLCNRANEQLWFGGVIRHIRILRYHGQTDQEIFDALYYTIHRDKHAVILGHNNSQTP